tara:strand:+ start:495 stop:716 length:222 start_codon:yes stop_codon:yes gene_type:complete
MKRTNKKELIINRPSLREHDLSKSLVGCAPCFNEVSKIDRQINERPLNEVKIDEIKKIVRSIFRNSEDVIKKN